MSSLPEKFIERMKKQLPATEWEAFFAVYENPPVKGARINPLKGDRYALKEKLLFLGEEVEWEENGYYTHAERAGSSPYYSAGLFYSQEPSAMCAAPLLEVQAGERVLDLCSAPGGKGTQLAGNMHGEGILVLNEPVFSRAKILSQNVERMGVQNAVVTCELPEKLSQKFQGYFDKILVDAPCSGEGMFRKNAKEALEEWSEENVALCAERQEKILDEAVKMLKVGGRLVYSTCTFSYEEDEGQVLVFLKNHPEMHLLKQEKLLPHKIDGEGHFAALFEKIEGGESKIVRPLKGRITPQAEKIFKEFEKECLTKKGLWNLYEKEGVLYALPKDVFDFTSLNILRVGVRLGEMKGNRFEPSHALLMSLKKEDFKNVLDLPLTDERVEKFLRGDVIEGDVKNGWIAVLVDGLPIGWGKGVNGTIKNHIPKGIRKLS